MQSSISERIKTIVDESGKSVKSFADEIGIPQTTLNNYILGKRKPSLDAIVSILNSNENIS